MTQWLSDRSQWRNPWYWAFLILPGLILYALWAWTIFRIAGDEGACLYVLQGVHYPPGSVGSVELTIDDAMALLVVLPTLGIPLFWMLGLAGDRTKAKRQKRGPAYLDDEIALCMRVQPDYRLISNEEASVPRIQEAAEGRLARESTEPLKSELRTPIDNSKLERNKVLRISTLRSSKSKRRPSRIKF
jgi:hypothetical protein